MNAQPTVFIVDDDPAMRDSLGFLIGSVGRKVETYASAEVPRRLRQQAQGASSSTCECPDSPTSSSWRSSARIGSPRRRPDHRARRHPHGGARAQGSAFDFIEKPFSDQVLLEDQQALQQDTSDRASEHDRSDIEQRAARLTTRENQVFELVVDGKPNKVVASDLGLSRRPSRSTALTSWRRCARRTRIS